ncbi:MAG: hypothetical protein ACJ8CR_24635, partial [Roseiflexaceae bacterium]
LVQPTIDGCRTQIGTNSQDGIAHYRLGLCYLNYTLLDQGLDELRQAAALLPERHIIRFELALIQSTPGKYAAGLDQIGQAVALAPANRDYQYLQHYLTGMTAQMRRELRPAMTSLIAAYELAPDVRLAADALAQFIAAHAAKLTQPLARSLPGLDQHDVVALQVLNSDPSAQQQKLPRAPKTPGELGKVSLSLLRKLSPVRAAAIEQMHAERIAVHQASTETHRVQYQMAIEQREAAMQEWQARAHAIHGDLLTMTRLCLAVVEEEERRRIEEERRRAEAERRRQEAEQKRLAEQQRRAQAQGVGKVREKQYLSTKARYIQGLPVGKEKDPVTLMVTNLQITARHSAMLGGWEHTIPMASLTEVTADTVKHLLSSEKRLRISYQDGRGMVAHAIFADLKVDDCVKNILKARSGK